MTPFRSALFRFRFDPECRLRQSLRRDSADARTLRIVRAGVHAVTSQQVGRVPVTTNRHCATSKTYLSFDYDSGRMPSTVVRFRFAELLNAFSPKGDRVKGAGGVVRLVGTLELSDCSSCGASWSRSSPRSCLGAPRTRPRRTVVTRARRPTADGPSGTWSSPSETRPACWRACGGPMSHMRSARGEPHGRPISVCSISRTIRAAWPLPPSARSRSRGVGVGSSRLHCRWCPDPRSSAGCRPTGLR